MNRVRTTSNRRSTLALATWTRRIYRLVAPRVGSWVPESWVEPVRERLFALSPADVVALVEGLEEAGCRPCVAGGWGIDALVGRQTRRHSDLDVIIAEGTDAVACAALAGLGYRQLSAEAVSGHHMPERVVARDDAGRIVDLLTLDLTAAAEQASAAPPPFGGQGAVAAGTIDGRPVRCLSAGVQWQFHQGYVARSRDRRDMARLEASLGEIR